MAIRPEKKRGGKTRAKKNVAKKAAKKVAKKKPKLKKKAKKKPAATANKKQRKKQAAKKAKGSASARKAKAPGKKKAASKDSPTSRARHAASVTRLYPERIGTVTHYFAQSQAAIVRLDRGVLQVGDAVHIRGHTTDFYERIEELKIDDRTVTTARAGQTIGIRLARTVRENDGVFLLSE